MESKKFLGQKIKVKIDRPLGSAHPKNGQIYSLNYGYIPGTMAPDGEEIDCYVLGVFEPVDEFEGECIAIIHRTNDDDDKIIIVPEGKGFSDEQIEVLTEFQEQYFKHEIWR